VGNDPDLWNPSIQTSACLDDVLRELSSAYRGDYYDQTSADFQAVQGLIRLAIDDGYGPSEFLAQVKRMIKQQEWATWTPAHFFKLRIQLHPYPWYLERIAETKANASLIDCYQLADGSHGWGWRNEIRNLLPLYRPNEKPAPKELPDHAEPMPDDVAAQLKEFVKDVDVKEMERQDQLDTITRLRAQLGAAQMERDDWKRAAADADDTIAALHAVMVDVCEGRITVEQLKSRATGEQAAGETQTTKVAA
jgi:hypothetical protein